MINWSIFYKLIKWFFSNFWGFLLETLCSSQFCELELNNQVVFFTLFPLLGLRPWI